MAGSPQARKILVLGSGPKVIGQGAECDYAAFHAARTLAGEGCQVVVVQSDPASLATDPGDGITVYLEPVTPEAVEKIVARERPDALLTTAGGASGQLVAFLLDRGGTCSRYRVGLLGADGHAIAAAEDPGLFRALLAKVGAESPAGQVVSDVRAGVEAAERLGFPVVVRAAFSLGGSGSATVYNREELPPRIEAALEAGPIRKAAVEESLAGWRELEVEMLRDAQGAVQVVALVQHADPVGVHAGDSIALLPPGGLGEGRRKQVTELARRVGAEVGVAGALSVRVALGPAGEIKLLGLTPRCSRTTALVARLSGLPLGEVSAKLALGHSLEELLGELLPDGRPLFERTDAYHVCRLPRFSFKRFFRAEPGLGTVMKSVGEVAALAASAAEALQKAARGLDVGRDGLGFDGKDFLFGEPTDDAELTNCLTVPQDRRLFFLQQAISRGWSVERVASLSGASSDLLSAIERIVDTARRLEHLKGAEAREALSPELLREAKASGFSDRQVAWLAGLRPEDVAEARRRHGIAPAYRSVAKADGRIVFATYSGEGDVQPLEGRKVLILGGGPSRIGQGIELDYCCAHACTAARRMGYSPILVNPSSEAVATDGSLADRVYLEPLTLEDVLAICEFERPEGVLAQVGGQGATDLAVSLADRGVPILGTDPHTMRKALSRDGLKEIAARLGLRVPPSAVATTLEEARRRAVEIGYPVVVRPTRALGGPTVDVSSLLSPPPGSSPSPAGGPASAPGDLTGVSAVPGTPLPGSPSIEEDGAQVPREKTDADDPISQVLLDMGVDPSAPREVPAGPPEPERPDLEGILARAEMPDEAVEPERPDLEGILALAAPASVRDETSEAPLPEAAAPETGAAEDAGQAVEQENAAT